MKTTLHIGPWTTAAGLLLVVLLANGLAYVRPLPATAGTPPTRPAVVVDVDVSQLRFVTAELRVARGTTVRWINRDLIPHTVASDDELWSSPLFGPGEIYERTFSDSGQFSYHCAPHPFMKGVVIVAKSSRDGP